MDELSYLHKMTEEKEKWDSGSYFTTILEVTQSWDFMKNIPDYERTVGALLYQKFFELEPNALIMFGFSEQNSLESLEDLFKDDRFVEHAKAVVRMLDLVIHLLGPDVELVEETLMDLGARHAAYGAVPNHFLRFGKALLYTVESLLGEERYNDDVKESWSTVFNYMSILMIQGAFKKQMEGNISRRRNSSHI